MCRGVEGGVFDAGVAVTGKWPEAAVRLLALLVTHSGVDGAVFVTPVVEALALP
jgi:hypothetical protein